MVGVNLDGDGNLWVGFAAPRQDGEAIEAKTLADLQAGVEAAIREEPRIVEYLAAATNEARTRRQLAKVKADAAAHAAKLAAAEDACDAETMVQAADQRAKAEALAEAVQVLVNKFKRRADETRGGAQNAAQGASAKLIHAPRDAAVAAREAARAEAEKLLGPKLLDKLGWLSAVAASWESCFLRRADGEQSPPQSAAALALQSLTAQATKA